MNILLDILGSSIIGGMILLMVLKLNIFASNANYYSDNELKLQQNVKTLAEILNYDLRKIGYKRDTTSMITAQPQRIKFYAELDAPGTAGHGTIDIVEYFLGDSTESTGTTNLRDKILYRVVNNTDTTGGSSLGLVDLKFSYMNAQGNTTANLDSIRYIKAEFWVEPQDAVTNYVTGQADTTVFTYWELTIYPRNI
ncbi:MAG TPA: hypothetical protein VK870_00500 [Ignavibacteriaceae bacterium]|nr:hypothetical protein [Ignavibacteriaceae bacterium]